uniref:Uncharacterized protein n=1 Tax=Theropithecus gelada TaxID=9565 RepID=A0A8D2EG19_THEGE
MARSCKSTGLGDTRLPQELSWGSVAVVVSAVTVDIKSICWEKQAFNESLLVSLKCISDMILRRSQLFINHFNKFAMISILNSE